MYSYLSNVLSEKFNADIVGYHSTRSKSIKEKIKRFIKNILPLSSSLYVYKSFGLKNIINLNKYIKFIDIVTLNSKYDTILKNTSKKKILNLKIDGIYIGDLLYDDFLRKFYVGSVDLENKIFLEHIYQFIKTFYLWRYYFKKIT